MLTKSTTILALLAVATAAPSFPKPVNHITNAAVSDWDYIIAGAGPAGIIVAERLAEKGNKVLLLERGGSSTNSTSGTANATWNTNGLTIYDVPSQDPSIFTTGQQKACDDTAGLAACLLGGGVEVNAMIFIKPADQYV